MPRRLPLLAVLATIVMAAPAFAQDSRFLQDLADAEALAYQQRNPVPSPVGWFLTRRVETGRITIEFQYAAPAGSSAPWRGTLSEATYGWVAGAASSGPALTESPALRTVLPGFEPFAGLVPTVPIAPGWDGGPPFVRQFGQPNRPNAWPGQPTVTSVQMTTESGSVALPVPAGTLPPAGLILEFLDPPVPQPLRYDDAPFRRSIHGADNWIASVF
jgi:hypothetical protein